MSNYGHYNIRVAQIVGLEAAVYLTELLNINEKALRKNKVEENFFTIDREYIKERTTLSTERQLELEGNLLKVGILEKADNSVNTLSVNLTVLTSILMSPDEKLIKNITKIAQQKITKRGKDEAVRDSLKSNIETTNEELFAAYSDWIDAVYAKEGWMSKKAIVNAQSVVDAFANRNLDIALKVIDIASVNGYRDMTWAVNAYKRDYNVSYRINETSGVFRTSTGETSSQVLDIGETPKLSDEVF